MATQFADADQQLGTLGLPIGWRPCATCYHTRFKFTDECWLGCWKYNLTGAGGLTIFGWLLTAFAVCLGAPFWFDMLNRLVNLRGTGANPAEKDGK